MEEKRQIPGYPNYFVTNTGRVFSTMSGEEKELKRSLRNGYEIVGLYVNQKSKTRLVHQLVMEAFVGPRPKELHTCHLDSVKTNNNLSNLVYETAAVNNGPHKLAAGKLARGEKNGLHKLENWQVRFIRLERQRLGKKAHGINFKRISELWGVSQNRLEQVASGRHWPEIEGFKKERK